MRDAHLWLPRALVESVLIVISILLALALDEWREDQEINELVDRSIASFEHELRSNKSRIEDVSAYHRGLEQLLRQQAASEARTRSAKEFRDIMEALQSTTLLTSAWQTALATGVLSRMPFDLVSALSLTYSTQNRFDESYQSEIRVLLLPSSLDERALDTTIFYAARFVAEATRAESELVVFYDQTLQLIEQYKEENPAGFE